MGGNLPQFCKEKTKEVILSSKIIFLVCVERTEFWIQPIRKIKLKFEDEYKEKGWIEVNSSFKLTTANLQCLTQVVHDCHLLYYERVRGWLYSQSFFIYSISLFSHNRKIAVKCCFFSKCLRIFFLIVSFPLSALS